MSLKRRLLCFGGLPLGLAISLMIGLGHVTWAAYTAKSKNTGDSYAAGSVIVDNSDTGATRSFPALAYGVPQTWCTTVTYTGSLTSDVRLAASAGGTIPNAISLVVDVGTGGDAACAGFSQTANLYTGTLGDLAANSGSWATGLGGFAGAGTGDARTYRFTAALNDDDAPAGSTATGTLTWEARNQ